MKIDLTITISVVLALAAIISPIIVSIINNKYQLKLKKIENYDIEKLNTFEKYSRAVGNYVTYGNMQHQLEMINSLYALVPYFNIALTDIKSIVDNTQNREIVIQKSNEILKIIKDQL